MRLLDPAYPNAARTFAFDSHPGEIDPTRERAAAQLVQNTAGARTVIATFRTAQDAENACATMNANPEPNSRYEVVRVTR